MASALLGRFLGAFQRRTSSGTFLPVIDGLRFVAIGSVLCYHIRYHAFRAGLDHPTDVFSRGLFTLIAHGDFGVELFFVISGFILALPFALHRAGLKRPVRLGAYFRRRLTRLEPPYILSLIIMFFLRTVFLRVIGLLPHLAASVLYLHNIIFAGPSAISAVTWSLEIEVQFYVLAPVLALGFAWRSKAGRRFLWLTAIVIAGVARELTISHTAAAPAPVQHLGLYVGFFLSGFLLADIFVEDWDCGSKCARGYNGDLVATVAWTGLGIWLCFGGRHHPLIPVVILLAYYGVMRSRIWFALLTNPVIYHDWRHVLHYLPLPQCDCSRCDREIAPYQLNCQYATNSRTRPSAIRCFHRRINSKRRALRGNRAAVYVSRLATTATAPYRQPEKTTHNLAVIRLHKRKLMNVSRARNKGGVLQYAQHTPY